MPNVPMVFHQYLYIYLDDLALLDQCLLIIYFHQNINESYENIKKCVIEPNCARTEVFTRVRCNKFVTVIVINYIRHFSSIVSCIRSEERKYSQNI